MKYKITIIGFLLLFFSVSNIKAQELANYNLYMQNSYLYNAAYTLDGDGISAFLNTHMQWAGFEEAPQVNTFGVHGAITKNSGLGLSVVQNTSGAVKNLMVRLNYAYRAKFADDHYLQLGTGLGITNDDLSGANSFTDLTDDVLTNDAFNGTSFSATAGFAYFNKGFELQFIMPQIYWRKELNYYSIGILSYNYEINSDWAVKPSVLARGVSTSPIQYDANLMGSWRNMIWAQAGYRSNSSAILGFGVNISSFALGYAYQMNNNDLANVSDGTHEIQLVYNLNGFDRKPKTAAVNGSVKSVVGGKALVSKIAFINTENVEKNADSDETGVYGLHLKNNMSYNVQIAAEGYYPHADVINIGEEETEKVFDYTLIPTTATLSGFVLRKGNNKPVVATIDILENGAKITSVKTNEKGAYEVVLKSGKEYTLNVSAENYKAASKVVSIKEKSLKKSANVDLVGSVELSGAVFSNEDNSEIASIIEIKKSGTVVETLNSTGKYSIHLPTGKYVLTVKAVDHITKKVSVDLSSSNYETSVQNINLDKLKKGEAFQLGNIEFKSGTAELATSSFAILDKLVTVMDGDETLRVELAGHTDSDGSAAGNKAISEKRAQACVDYLVSKGIAATRLESKGFGESKPTVANNSPANKAKNRRVEFKFID